MGHIELRPLTDDDLDAVFEMMRDREAVARAAFTAADPDDRAAFDEWMLRQRRSPDVSMHVVTEDGGFIGTAGAFTVDGDREITYWIARRGWGRGVGTAALQLLVSHEAERPLYARVATANTASRAMLERLGFTEVSRNVDFAPGVGRDVEECVYVLAPAIE